MLELLISFNTYFAKYTYMFILAVFLLVFLFYLFPELKKLSKHLNYIADNGQQISLKLETINTSTNTIKESVDKNLPIIAGIIGILSVLKILKKVFKKTKGKKHSVSSLITEYAKESRKKNFVRNTSELIKTIKPVVEIIKGSL